MWSYEVYIETNKYIFNKQWNGDSAAKLSSLSMDKESGLVKRKWFTNIVRIVRTYFAFQSFDLERI
jgi:hypothetical protein